LGDQERQTAVIGLLVAVCSFLLEPAAQELSPQPPLVVMGGGVIQAPFPRVDVQSLTLHETISDFWIGTIL